MCENLVLDDIARDGSQIGKQQPSSRLPPPLSSTYRGTRRTLFLVFNHVLQVAARRVRFKKLKRCEEKYRPFIIECEPVKEAKHYCDVRLIKEPVKITVECSRHNQARLEEFGRLFKEHVENWAKVRTPEEFDNKSKAALADIFEPTVLSEVYEHAKDTMMKGFYAAISVAIDTHIAHSLNRLKDGGLTSVTPAQSVSSTRNRKGNVKPSRHGASCARPSRKLGVCHDCSEILLTQAGKGRCCQS